MSRRKYLRANRDRYYSKVSVIDTVDNSRTIYAQNHSSRDGAERSQYQRGVYYNNYLRDPGQYVFSESGKLPGKKYRRK